MNTPYQEKLQNAYKTAAAALTRAGKTAWNHKEYAIVAAATGVGATFGLMPMVASTALASIFSAIVLCLSSAAVHSEPEIHKHYKEIHKLYKRALLMTAIGITGMVCLATGISISSTPQQLAEKADGININAILHGKEFSVTTLYGTDYREGWEGKPVEVTRTVQACKKPDLIVISVDKNDPFQVFELKKAPAPDGRETWEKREAGVTHSDLKGCHSLTM
ncbi:MAG: hypothetical protein WC612_03740 [Bdellovibrionales bacterium]|jgi:hypothetical protein